MCWENLSLDGPAEGAEAVAELLFGAFAVVTAVAVAEGVEGGGVAGFGEVGEFVADDVVAELGGEEDVDVGEADAALAGVACAEDAVSVGCLQLVDSEAEAFGYAACAGDEEPGRYLAGDELYAFVDALLDVGGGDVGAGAEDDVEYVVAPLAAHGGCEGFGDNG